MQLRIVTNVPFTHIKILTNLGNTADIYVIINICYVYFKGPAQLK